MDEQWDGEKLKFRRGGKSLTMLSLKENKVTALIVFGKAERAAFEQHPRAFSDTVQERYRQSKTFHDGKWMFIDVTDMAVAKDVLKLLEIKKRPNRKPASKDIQVSVCGFLCGLCWYNIHSVEDRERRTELTYGLSKAYGDGADQRAVVCKTCIPGQTYGMEGTCKCGSCAVEKGLAHCTGCEEARSCELRHFIHPGRCTPGLTAHEVTAFVYPYCHRFLESEE
jgi:hypothetical protein